MSEHWAQVPHSSTTGRLGSKPVVLAADRTLCMTASLSSSSHLAAIGTDQKLTRMGMLRVRCSRRRRAGSPACAPAPARAESPAPDRRSAVPGCGSWPASCPGARRRLAAFRMHRAAPTRCAAAWSVWPRVRAQPLGARHDLGELSSYPTAFLPVLAVNEDKRARRRARARVDRAETT